MRAADQVRAQQRRAHLAADHAADRAHDRVHAGRDSGLGRLHGFGDQRRHRRESEADARAEDRHRREDLPRM